MAKLNDPEVVVEEKPQVAQETEFKMSVKEFCARLSTTDRRVEMIGGFYSDEVRLGHFSDFEPAFRSRFDAFTKRPA